MHDSRVGQLIDLFERALEVPHAQRTEFLERMCADDPSLRTELSALLAANESATG